MRRWFLMLLCLLPMLGLKANHWEPDPYLFPDNMNVVGVIEINGLEQTSEALELGAFCDAECRGSEMLTYYPGLNRYLAFLTIYGEAGNEFTFRLYDHNAQLELNLDCNQSLQFVANGVVGNVTEPFVISFTGGTCTISVNVEPEVGGAATGGGTFTIGETCTLTATPYPTYFFSRWSENGETVSVDSIFSFVATGDRSLTAEFERVTYWVDARPMPDTAGVVEGMGSFVENDTCTLSAMANEGFTFVDWTEDGQVVSTSLEITFTVTSNRFLVANFSLNTYEITLEALPEEGGTVMGEGLYDYGAMATVEAQSHDTYYFINWTEDGELVSTEAAYAFVVDRPRHLVATFAQQCYTVEVAADPAQGGTVQGGGNYIEGTICHLKACPSQNYVFSYWTEGGNVISTEPEWSFVVEGNRSFVAHFVYYDGLLEKENALSVFPNPTEGMVHLEGVDGTIIRLFDMFGRMLLETSVPANRTQLDLSPLPTGCYFLKVGETVKIILKR